MDIITRNFFRLLRSGALNEYEQLEPMSNFKWDLSTAWCTHNMWKLPRKKGYEITNSTP